MIEKCFDEGTIQGFLDGEIDLTLAETVSHHIAVCDSCASLVAEAESEIEFAFSALDFEENNLVPTERLWTKINYSIEAESKSRSIWQSVLAFLSTPSAIGFASLVIVFGLFVGLYGLKNGSEIGPNNSVLTNPSTGVETASSTTNAIASQPKENVEAVPVKIPEVSDEAETFKPRTAVYARSEPQPRRASVARSTDATLPSNELVAEQSYIKTIATLESSINGRKDEVLRPSARFSYERDLAVANDTIEKMKGEVRSNPKNEAARILLRTSYQNKIDLLNSVAEKSELIASLN